MTLSAFIAFLAGQVKPATIQIYLAAIRNLHIELGYDDPLSQATLLPKVLRGIARVHGDGVTQPRLPITMPILRRLLSALQASHCYSELDKQMIAAVMLLAFHGFSRSGEIVSNRIFDPTKHATHQDVQFTVGPPTTMQFHIKYSKTDQCGRGISVHFGPTGDDCCAVRAMLLYLNSSGGAAQDQLFRFADGRPRTRGALVEKVRQLVTVVRINNASLYSGHSFRIGAATTATLARTPEWLIRVMGRWRSDSVLRYIRTSPLAMQQVASALSSVSEPLP